MKTRILGILLAILMVVSVFALTACEDAFGSLFGEHEHQWSEWEIITEPTCTTIGEKTRFCTCGESETVNIVATGHTYVDGVCHCGSFIAGYENFFIFTLLDDGTYSIKAKDVDSFPSKVVIPKSHKGKPVTVIADAAFAYYGIKSITIPDSVTSIGNSAFLCCNGLTSITIPDSVTSIGFNAFVYCSRLTSITIPNSVTTIGWTAFADTNIANIVIPESVISIGENALSGCNNLKNIEVNENNQYYKSIDGNLYSKDGKTLIQYSVAKLDTTFEIPKGVTYIENNAFLGCSRLTSIMIPDSVASIGYGAFNDCCNLVSIAIPDSIVSIGHNAFNNTAYYANESNWVDDVLYIGNHLIEAKNNITGEYTIKNGTIVIADNAFYWRGNLTSITISDSVTSIGNSAFSGCSGLTSISIPDSVTSIGDSAFSYCESLTSIVIPDSVTSIGNGVFNWCDNLTSIKVDENNQCYKSNNGNLYSKNGKTLIRYNAGKTDVSFDIPNNVEIIDDYAFEGCCRLTSIAIPNSVTSIGNYSFFNCYNLKSVVIPDSVTSIGISAFSGCSNLTNMVIPDSVTFIGDSAFWNCPNLTDVYYTGTEEEWAKIDIDNTYDGNDYLLNATIHYNYVPEE